MNRTLNLFMLTFYAIGMILGAGVFSVIGKAAGIAQEGLWVSFLIAGVAALLTALSYAELSTIYPEAGAEYVYLKNIFPQFSFLSFACGTLMIFASVATASSVAIAFAAYLEQFVPVPIMMATIAVLLLFTVVNILGVQESAWMNVVFTTIEIAGLLIFVHFGVTETTYFKPLTVPFSFSVIPAAGLVFFAYLGFESMVNLAEEAKDPEKNIPRAIFISLFFTTVIYVLVGLAALALMSPAELSNASAVLSEALQGKSPMAAKVLGGIALFSTGNTVMIGMMAGSRITLGMARRHDLPFIFSKIWGKKQTPWLASILIFALCLFFLPLEKVEIIASVSSLVTIAVFVVINCSVIYLRYEKPELKRPFRIPGSLGKLPLPSLLAVLASVTLVLDFSQQVYWVAAAIVGVILLVYGVMRLFKK